MADDSESAVTRGKNHFLNHCCFWPVSRSRRHLLTQAAVGATVGERGAQARPSVGSGTKPPVAAYTDPCLRRLRLPQESTSKYVAPTADSRPVLEARNPRSRCRPGWFLLTAPFLASRCHLLTTSLHSREGEGASYKSTSPHRGPHQKPSPKGLASKRHHVNCSL